MMVANKFWHDILAKFRGLIALVQVPTSDDPNTNKIIFADNQSLSRDAQRIGADHGYFPRKRCAPKRTGRSWLAPRGDHDKGRISSCHCLRFGVKKQALLLLTAGKK
jgi:hypothetical protein